MSENNYTFRILENGLNNDTMIPFLKATNNVYEITIVYANNYKEDFINHKINRLMTTVMVKHDNRQPDISYKAGRIFVEIPFGALIPLRVLENYSKGFERAKKSAEALAEIMKEYGFPVLLEENEVSASPPPKGLTNINSV